MRITDLMDGDLLDRMITEGYIRVVKHPTLPLTLLGYSDKCQFDRRWNDATMNCRGLIIDDEGFIVARPWKKFFNLGEGLAEIDFEMPVEVTDKIDGSLGILYREENGYAIATRGSFSSDQAAHATQVWKERYSNLVVPDSHTFLFEIVYPANRIVLNYGDMDDLVLLGAVHKEYGYYLGPGEAQGLLGWEGPVTKVFEYRTMGDAFAADPRPNAEGFVIRSGNSLVKIKQVDYLELHRIVTNLSERTVWQMMKEDKTLSDICEPIPDEWHDWVKKVYNELVDKYSSQEFKVLTEFALIDKGVDRKSFAMVASKSPNRAYLFRLYDKKPIFDMIMDSIKPSGAKE